MAQSANWKQLRRADQILQDAKLDLRLFQRVGPDEDGGVQQLVSERDECSGDGVPEACSKCWYQCAKDLAKWSAQ